MVLHKCKGHPDVRHVKCGGQVSATGTGYIKLPVGFGFSGTKFVVDRMKYLCYQGFCLKCKADGTFVRVDVPGVVVREIPDGINRKIESARKKESAQKLDISKVKKVKLFG